MEKHELTFNDIFKEDGLYRNDSNFADGIALEVKDGQVFLIDWTSTFKQLNQLVITNNMVNKYKYYKVHNKSQLFSNGIA